MPLKNLFLLTVVILLEACATQPGRLQISDYQQTNARNCALFVNKVEQSIHSSAVVDYQQDRVVGYPYLRVDRTLASFTNDIDNRLMFEQWLQRMMQLGQEGWTVELLNLNSQQQQELFDTAKQFNINTPTLEAALTECSQILATTDFDEEQEQQQLIDSVYVADDYQTWKRFVGVYPVSALFFRAGIDDWHEQAQTVFSTPLDTLPVTGELLSYIPDTQTLSASELQSIMTASTENALAIPTLTETDLTKLYDHHAPVFEIDTADNDDRIGSIMLKDGYPLVNTNDVQVYRYPSYTRIKEHTLLQLNYMIWFPSRPKTSSLDLLGGHLDSIIWRVTLSPDGKPWLYDSIHACGCYHMVFPTQYSVSKEPANSFAEPLLIAPGLNVSDVERAIVRISSRSHDIQQVYFDETRLQEVVVYTMTDGNVLRSLASGNDSRQSLYQKNGIVSSSKRGERFFFWPMGIASPGAMRQPGNHATAFVGRRHFDDADLFQPYFDLHMERGVGYVSN